MRGGGSLRRRLVLATLCAVAAVWLFATLAAHVETRHEIDELLDGYLAQTAGLVLAIVGDDAGEIEVEHAPQLHRYARHVAFQVWERGRLRVHSANAPDVPLAVERDGFSDTTIDGRRWRVFTSREPGRGVVVQVAEARRERDSLAASIAWGLIVPLAVALPLLALVQWPAIELGLRPLRRLGVEVARRDPRNLASVDVGTPPVELAPLVASLNALFGRLRDSIEHEKRFTADAAHELRTPIAALRAQAQVAQGASDDVERTRALAQVVAGCDRATRLIAQLLTLARLDPAGGERPLECCDLVAIARTVVAEAAPEAIGRSVDVALDAAREAPVHGARDLIEILVRNLVDNAIRYAPPGAAVRVIVKPVADAVELRVVDDGPGIAPEAMGRLGERFFRAPGSREAGSGLGLSIVRRIAELGGATVAFASNAPARGLTVTVRFAVAGAAATRAAPRTSRGARPATPGSPG